MTKPTSDSGSSHARVKHMADAVSQPLTREEHRQKMIEEAQASRRVIMFLRQQHEERMKAERKMQH